MLRDKTVVSKLIRRAGLFLFGLIILTTVLIGLQGSSHKADALSNANTLNFQARLLTSSGAIVPDGTYNIDFRLYSSATGAPVDVNTSTMASCTSPCEWEETYAYSGFSGDPGTYSGSVGPQLTVKDGYVSVYLGTYAAFPSGINWSIPQYLTMDIDQNGTTSSGAITWDGEMVGTGNSRIQLTSVPSAFTANQLATNSGSNTLTLGWGSDTAATTITLPDIGGLQTLCLENDALDCGYAPGTSSSYIQNQNSSPQSGANYDISGTGTEANSVVTGNSTIGSCLTTCAPALGAPSTDSLTLADGTNNNVITLAAGATATSYSLTLPTGPPQSNQCIMTASTSTSQLVYGACNGGPTLQYVGEWDAQNSAPPGKSLSLSILSGSSTPGDLVVLAVQVPSDTNPSIPFSSGNVDNWQQVPAANVSGSGGALSKMYLFYGTVYNAYNAATCTANPPTCMVTVTFQNSIGSASVSHIMAMEFSSGNGAGTIWTAYNGTPQANSTSSTSVNYPSITSHIAGELYWSYAYMPGTSTLSSVGACGNFTCFPDTAGGTASRQTQAAYTVNTTSTDVYQAVGTQGTTNQSVALGAMFAASAGSYINDGTSSQNANFDVVSANSANQAGILEGNIGQTADILDVDYQSSVGVAVPVFTVGATGSTAVNTITNSVNGFQVNATSGQVISANALNVDTTNLSVDNGSLTMAADTPTIVQSPSAAPTFSQVGSSTSTSYSYEVTAVGTYGGESLASPVGIDSNGDNTLSTSNYNKINFTSVAGVTYKVYRTASSGNPSSTGLIATVTATSTSSTVSDQGQPASGTIPALASTGGLSTSDSYMYEVVAIDSQGGQSIVSNPTGAGCTTATTKNMLISWPAVNGAKSYRIYRGFNTTGSCSASYIGYYMTTNTNFYNDTTTTWTTAGTPNTTATGYINNLTANGTANIVLGNGGVEGTGVQLYLGGSISSLSSTTPPYASVSTMGTPLVEAIQGHYLYVTTQSTSGVQIFDITNPAMPVQVGTITAAPFNNTGIKNLFVSGNYLYAAINVSGNISLGVANITNPASPSGITQTTIASSLTVAGAVLSGSNMYIAEQTSGTEVFQVVSITNPATPVVVDTTPLSTGDAPSAVALYGNYLYVAESGLYVQVYNVSTPSSPTLAGTIPTSLSISNMTVNNGYMYSDGGSTFAVWSLSNPANPIVTYNGGTLAHAQTDSIRAYGNYLYMPTGTGASGGTVVYDVSQPYSPVYVGDIDSQSASNDIVVQGDYAYEIDLHNSLLNVWTLGGELVQNLQTGSNETNTLVVDNSATLNGATNINGSLTVAGSTQLYGNLGIAGQETLTGGSANELSVNSSSNISVFNVNASTDQTVLGSQTGGVVGTLALDNGANTNAILLTVASATPGYTLTLPNQTPTAGLCIETGSTTATAGQLTYASCGNANPDIGFVREADTATTSGTTSTLSFTSVTPGDVVIVTSKLPNSAYPAVVSSISGDGITWGTSAVVTSGYAGSSSDVEIWKGVVTTPTAGTITVGYTGSVGTTGEISATEFTASGVSTNTEWDVYSTGTNNYNSTSTSTVNFTYNPLSSYYAGELYFGYAQVTTPGTTSPCLTAQGFVCTNTTTQSNDFTYNTDLSPNTSYAATSGQAAGTVYNAAAIILTVFTSNTFINNSTATQSGNFNIQASTPTSVAGVLESGGTGDILDLENSSGTKVFSVDSSGNTTDGATLTVSGSTTLNSTTTVNASGVNALIVASSSSSNPTFSVNTTGGNVGVGTFSAPTLYTAGVNYGSTGPWPAAASVYLAVVGVTSYGGLTAPLTYMATTFLQPAGATITWYNEPGISSYRLYYGTGGSYYYYLNVTPGAGGKTTGIVTSSTAPGYGSVSGAIAGSPPATPTAYVDNLGEGGSNTLDSSTTTALTVMNSSGVDSLNVNGSNASISVGQLTTPTAPTSIPNPLTGTTFALSGTCSGSSTSYTYYITGEQTYGGQSYSTSVTDSTGATSFSTACQNTITIPSVGLGGAGDTFNIYRESGSAATPSVGFIGSVAVTGPSASFVDYGQVATNIQAIQPVSNTVSVTGGLANSTTYYYQVVAVDSNGGLSLPSAEAALATVANAKTISMSWPAVAGAKSYRVYVGTTSGGESTYFTTNTNSFTDLSTTVSINGGVSGVPSAYPTTIGFADNLNTGQSSSTSANIVIGSGSTGSANVTSQLFLGGNIPSSYLSTTPLYSGGTISENGPNQEAVSGNYLYIADTTNVQIYDISNPASPVLVSTLSGYNNLQDLAISGNYLYFYYEITGHGYLNIYNVANPAAPQVVYAPTAGSYTTSSMFSAGMTVSGNYLYLLESPASANGYFVIYNVSNPANPTIVYTSTSLAQQTEAVAVSNNVLYVTVHSSSSATNNSSLVAYDISSPSHPVLLPGIVPGGLNQNWSLQISGNYLYSSNQTNLNIYNIAGVGTVSGTANVGGVVLISSTNIGQIIESVAVYGRYAYISTSAGIYVMDISNPQAPVLLGNMDPAVTGGSASYADAVVKGRYLYGLDAGPAATYNSLDVFDMGGEYVQNLQAGTTETDTLQVDSSANVAGNTTLSGNLNVSGQTQLNGGFAAVGVANIQGGLTVGGLQPPGAPTVVTVNSANAKVVVYAISAVSASGQVGAPSLYGETTNGPNVAMSPTEYSLITWNAIPGAASYDVWLVSTTQTYGSTGQTNPIGSRSSTTIGFLGNTVSTANCGTTSNLSCAPTNTSYLDEGQTVNTAIPTPTGDASGTFTDNGVALFENGVNSPTAFQIATSSGAVIFNANTAGTSGVNPQIVIGVGSAHTDTAAVLLVLDNQASSTTGDPATEVNGAMYYNTYTNTFRCGQAGVWVNCIGGLLGSNTAASTAITGTTATIGSNIDFSTNALITGTYCSQGRTISLTAAGVYSTDATNVQPITFGIYLGSTLIGVASPSYTPSAGITNQGWKVNYDLICDSVLGSSASVTGEGQVALFGTTSTSTTLSMYTNNTPATVNTNATLNLYLGVTYGSIGTNSANNTITADQFIVSGK